MIDPGDPTPSAEEVVGQMARLAAAAGARLDAVNEVSDELKGVKTAVVDLTAVLKAQPSADQYETRIAGLEKLLVERDKELKNRTFRTNMAMFLVAVLVLGFLFVGSQQRQEIRGCTEPGHACYARGQRQAQKSIQNVRDDTRSTAVAAVECSPLMPNEKEFERCLDSKVSAGR